MMLRFVIRNCRGVELKILQYGLTEPVEEWETSPNIQFKDIKEYKTVWYDVPLYDEETEELIV